MWRLHLLHRIANLLAEPIGFRFGFTLTGKGTASGQNEIGMSLAPPF